MGLISVSIVTWNSKREKDRKEILTLLNAVYALKNYKTKKSLSSIYELVKCLFVLCAVTGVKD